jgi:sugar lactone lactonase YvrE
MLVIATSGMASAAQATKNGPTARESHTQQPKTTLLASGLLGSVGSTIGPDGALYVTEGISGQIARVDPETGQVTTFASGLPVRRLGNGGAMDVAFLDGTAYVIVTLVGPDTGGSNVVGIYRMESPDSFSVFADIGAYSTANPPPSSYTVPTGVQYALQTYKGGFLVTDGHHNRLLWVSPEGEISDVIDFDNNVPTGLDVRGNRIFMAEAGPVPHLPEDGKVVEIKPKSSTAKEIASGAPLLVDVEFGRGHKLYVLSQGEFHAGNPPGSPAIPNTGSLLRVNKDGSLTKIIGGLDRPTSLEIIGKTAYFVSLAGQVWMIEDF